MTPKRIFRFAYHTSLVGNEFSTHHLRDGDAFAELSAVLYSKGYQYGGLLLNFPSGEPLEPIPDDVSFLTSSDLVLLNTRPPIHDIDQENKHPVRRSYSTLEKHIFEAVEARYFKRCARSQITLAPAIAKRLPAEFRDRGDITFRQYERSYIKHREGFSKKWRTPVGQELTAAFFIQIPALWKDGPGLLAAFGMAGTETLAWNYLLRTRYLKHWLDSDQFVMAEILPGKTPARPNDLSFAEEWKVVPILRIPLTQNLAP